MQRCIPQCHQQQKKNTNKVIYLTKEQENKVILTQNNMRLFTNDNFKATVDS